jgi:hypothetical protein
MMLVSTYLDARFVSAARCFHMCASPGVGFPRSSSTDLKQVAGLCSDRCLPEARGRAKCLARRSALLATWPAFCQSTEALRVWLDRYTFVKLLFLFSEFVFSVVPGRGLKKATPQGLMRATCIRATKRLFSACCGSDPGIAQGP